MRRRRCGTLDRVFQTFIFAESWLQLLARFWVILCKDCRVCDLWPHLHRIEQFRSLSSLAATMGCLGKKKEEEVDVEKKPEEEKPDPPKLVSVGTLDVKIPM